MAAAPSSSTVQDNMDTFPLFTSFTKSEQIADALPVDESAKEVLDSKDDMEVETSPPANATKDVVQRAPAHHAAFCDICSVSLSGQVDYESHVKGRKHLLMQKNVLSKNPQYKQATYDELCQAKQQLITSNTESNNTDGAVIENNSTPAPPVANSFLCHLCNVTCNSQGMLNDHNNGKKHQAKLKLQNKPAAEPSTRAAVDNNPSSSNYCDVCSVRFNSEAKLAEHLAHKRHLQRVKDEEFCAQEATNMNINFSDYEVGSVDDKNSLFAYECTKCNKKFGNKVQLIGHLKSAAHNYTPKPVVRRQPSQELRRFPRPNATRGPMMRREPFQASRGRGQSFRSTRPSYHSQPIQPPQPFHRAYDGDTSTNIFGAFDPDNIYSAKRSMEPPEDRSYNDQSYPKRARMYHNENDSQHFQYSYPPYESSYPPPSAPPEFDEPPHVAYSHRAPCFDKPRYEEHVNSYPTTNYAGAANYPSPQSSQPPLPNYEPPYPPSEPPPPPPPPTPPPPPLPPSQNFYLSYPPPADFMSNPWNYGFPPLPFN